MFRTFSLLLIAATIAAPHALFGEPINLALHKDYVSSAPNTQGWDKPGLTDGVWGTDGSTCYATDQSPDFPKNVTIDLGTPQAFTTVVVSMPPFGSTKTVDVSVSSDGTTFTPFGEYVFKMGEQQRAVLTGSAQARYVRLTYVDHYSQEAGYPSTFAFTSELEVYNGDAPSRPDMSLLAVTPSIKDEDRHEQFLQRIAQGPVGLLFLGDSITDWWPRKGEFSWLKFAPYQPADFGIAGDRTEHLIWRITHGELDGIDPKVTVIMIGTNNVDRDTPQWAAAAIQKIIGIVQEKLPKTKILLLGVFPRDGHDSLHRQKNAAVNEIISKFANGDSIQYLDIGQSFLQPDGDISPQIMPDGLHPSEKGYELWYEAMQPQLEGMMK
jgi:beta-glucosidase